MILEYNSQEVFTMALKIEDMGNVAIRCVNDKSEEYYIATRTMSGKTGILKFGPVIPDLPMIPNGFELSYKKIDYNEPKITKELNLLVNDPKKLITTATEITLDDMESAMPILKYYFGSAEDLMLDEEE